MKTLFALILAGALALIALPIQAQDETPAEKASDTSTSTTEKTEKADKTEKAEKAGDTKEKSKKKTAKPAKEAAKSDAGQTSMAMSKEKAQNMVLQKYPGAKVITSAQDTVKGSQVWVVTIQRTGSNLSEKVMVDQSGKVSRM